MKKTVKIFMVIALTVLMGFTNIPVNTVFANDGSDTSVEVTETNEETEVTETTELPAEGTPAEEPAEELPAEDPAVEEEPVEDPVYEVEEIPQEEPEEVAEVPAEEPAEEETPEAEPVVLNAEAYTETFTVGDLEVTVSYEAGTVPEGTAVVVGEAKPEAVEALKAELGEYANFAAADISFVWNDEEIEPKDFSDKNVSVTLKYAGEEDLGETEFETKHVAETVNEDGTVTYAVQDVKAVMTPVTTVVSVPYEYTWTEEVTKYKDVEVYEDVEVPYEVEEPVYETREVTEERTTYVTKTRQVEKTRTVRVKVAFKWYDPSTWLGYKYVTEKYYVTEEYQVPVTETVVVGYEEVQVGTKTVTKYRTEKQYVRTDSVPDGTETVTHTETRYRDEEVVLGQTAEFEAGEFSTFTMTWGNYNGNSVTIHHGVMVNGSFVEFGTNGLPSSSNTNYPTTLRWSDYNNDAYAVLIYDFKDYSYSATYYRTNTSATPASGGTAIWPALQKRNATGSTNDNWRYCNATSTSWNRDGACANNSHIYVIYTPKTITNGYAPSGGGDDPGTPTTPAFTPDVGKNVTDQKPDGTYDITLGFVGNKDTTETKTTARVIVVFDLSGSMNYNMAGGTSTSQTNPSRLTLAKRAVDALADTLLNLKDKQGNKLVEMGLVTFATDGRIRTFGTNASNFTSDPTTYKGVIDNLPISGNDTIGTGINQIGSGTNWEKGLDLANSMATSEAGKTYIIFVSDGDPTYRVSRGNYTDAQVTSEMTFSRVTIPIFGSGYGNEDRNYSTAREVAKSIVDHKKVLYTVGLSNNATRMTNLATYAGGTYKPGNDADEFAASLAEIAGSIEKEIGLTDVVISDGVTDMSQISTESLIGTAGEFVYNKSYPLTAGDSDYTYTIGETTYTVTQAQVDAGSDGTHKIFSRQIGAATVYYVEYPWDDIPEAAEADVNENNAVIWNTAAANSQLEHGVYYSVTFTVWPKQEAYDLIADLDNGIRHITDADLEAGTKAQLRVLVNGTTYEYVERVPSNAWMPGDLTDAQMQALIDAAGYDNVAFSMKTNTGLSATYKYGGVENSANYTNYTNGNMTLDDTAINIKKTWNNYMDARAAANVTLTIIRNDTNYMDVVMGEPREVTTTDGGKQWVQEPATDLYISLGVMSVTDGNITIRETGYDYTVVEPENFQYRWDLTADIYHPMVINGVTTILIEVQDTTGLPASVTGLGENKTITVDGTTYYKFNNELYVAKPGDTLLEATNDRRSNLFVNKVVNEEDAPADDLFPFEITLRNPNDPLPTEEGYDDFYNSFWFYVSTEQNNTGTMIIEDLTVSDNVHKEVDELRTNNTSITDIVTHEADDEHPYPYITYNYNGTPNLKRAVDLDEHTGTNPDTGETYTYYSYYTGYYWFDNGETVTINIEDGWYINFNNVARESTYTIVEPIADLPDNYTFVKAETDAENMQAEEVTPGTVEENTVTGTIDKSNSDYNATYTNKYEGVYYVYHSSNNEVYRFPMAVDGVKVETFDIYAMTAEGTLYGGYYSDYAGKSTGYESKNLTFDADNKSNDANGTAYTYQYISDSNRAAWNSTNAYTTVGTAAVPVKDTTYYLKEVPSNYLLPYTHYTYYKQGYKIANMLTITATDDLNYNKVGFVIVADNQDATMVDSLTIKAANSSTTTTLTPNKVYKAKGVLAGYLGYYDMTSYMSNSSVVIKQFWTTIDGITVTGTTQRTLTFGDGTITGLKKTDAPVQP